MTMEHLNVIMLVSLVSLSSVLAQQRAPPGVPPNQYQQGQQNVPQYQQPPQQHQQYQRAAPGVPPSQYQQQQQQYQQPPQAPQQQQYQPPHQQQQQQFQPPPPPPPQQQQQQQQQQQHYQAPQHDGGHHHSQQQQQRVLHGNNLKDERDHIKDHLEVPLDTAGMSEEELQYHYFKMHDADNNNRLDGQELIKSLFHWHDSSNHDPSKSTHPPPTPKIFTDEELISMIDPIMDQDDGNRDGYIDYPEFVSAQRKAAANAGAKAP